MTLASLFLVGLASFAHASWNLLAKRAESVGPVFVVAYNLAAGVASAPWVIWLLAQPGQNWTWVGIGFVVASGVIHLAYSLCLQRGYQVADLWVVYPVARGTGPMLPSIGAILILGETPSGNGRTGLALVVAGILLIATQGKLSAFSRPGRQAGVRWDVGTGGLIACYALVEAYAVKTLGIAPVLLDGFSNLMRFGLLLPLVLANPRKAMAAMTGY